LSGVNKKEMLDTRTSILAKIAMTMLLLALALPAAASDHTLGVFGNANEDETINMQDVTYTELIILEYRDRTELADAKHDGKINMQDVTQIELVILGKEKELTFLDLFGEAETVDKPIERLANLGLAGVQLTRVLGAEDILVAVGHEDPLTPFLEQPMPPIVGWGGDTTDFEKILGLKPDAVFANTENLKKSYKGFEQKRFLEEKLPGTPIICLCMRPTSCISTNARLYGYIIDREDEAEEFCDWFDGCLNTIKDRTEGLTDDEKLRVYWEIGGRPYTTGPSGRRYGEAVLFAGGRNIADEIIGPDDLQWYSRITVDAEWVVEQNPDIILIVTHSERVGGYATDDPAGIAAMRQELLDRPELAECPAVKDGHVYVISDTVLCGAGASIIGITHFAKVLYPDLFTDIDPEAVHQEYLGFQELDFNVYGHGVFVYPLIEES